MRTHLIANKQDRLWQGIPGIERAANGRLWAALYTGGPKEPDPDNHVLLTTSADDGRTWSSPRIAVRPPGPMRAYDPTLWHDPDGRLWLIYNLGDLENGVFPFAAITTDDSSAADPVWSAERRWNLGVGYIIRMNKPTVLSTGEWVLPVSFAREVPDKWFARETLRQGVAISTDKGESWKLYGEVEAPNWALETMIVERRDGVLWMLIRTGSDRLWQSFSHDRGRTWSPGERSRIVNPGTRFFIRRLQSGRLLLINTPVPNARTTMVATVSDVDSDSGFPQTGGLMLDAREKVSYPDAVQAPDGTIYAVHDCDRYGPGEVILNVFTEEEVLAAQRGG
ncbi:MAG TPA: sialidase family protein [Candidatus Latescibacteria bacterium]|nr:sialidase family protein [Candidatus Latescibacterota bacterium]